PDAAPGDDVVLCESGVAGRAQRRRPHHAVRVVLADDRVHLGQQARVVGWNRLTLTLIRDDLHLATPQHVVGVDEVLPGGVELDALLVALVKALGLQDGVDLGAVVRQVVDQRDLVPRDPADPVATAVARQRRPDRPRRARRRVEVHRRVELATSHAGAGVPRVGSCCGGAAPAAPAAPTATAAPGPSPGGAASGRHRAPAAPYRAAGGAGAAGHTTRGPRARRRTTGAAPRGEAGYRSAAPPTR